MTIKIVDAIAGAGKTTAIIKAAIEEARTARRPVNISLPTRAVIDEKIEDAKALAGGEVPILRVDSDTAHPLGISVAQQLAHTLEEIGSQRGVVLFTTHKTFNDCPNWIGRRDWKFYIDELFDPITSVVLRVPRSYHLLTDLLELVTPDAEFSEVRPREGTRHRLKLMRDGSDEAERVFDQVAQYLAHPERWTLHVRTANFQLVTSGIGRSRVEGERDLARELVFWAVARPWFDIEGLDVTMASACLRDRLLYKLWSSQGTEFETDDAVMQHVPTGTHNGAGLKLLCMNLEHWSSYAKNGVHGGAYGNDEPITPQRAFEALIAAEFGTEPFIYNANTAWTDEHRFPSGVRLPLVMHGKNAFASYRKVAFMPSTLPVPDKWRFLTSLGFSDDDIRDEYYHSHAYQTVFRSAARLAHREGEVTALLPGHAACAYIQRRAPGAEIVVRDVLLPRRGVGRPAKFKDASERRASEACRLWLRRHPGKTAQDYRPREARKGSVRQAA